MYKKAHNGGSPSSLVKYGSIAEEAGQVGCEEAVRGSCRHHYPPASKATGSAQVPAMLGASGVTGHLHS